MRIIPVTGACAICSWPIHVDESGVWVHDSGYPYYNSDECPDIDHEAEYRPAEQTAAVLSDDGLPFLLPRQNPRLGRAADV